MSLTPVCRCGLIDSKLLVHHQEDETMPYDNAAEWIRAFTDAMNDILGSRSGSETFHGPRFRAEPCGEHPDCVWVRFDGNRLHVAWKKNVPDDIATSLAGS
jgi:hypothetical protein